ncbi:DUF2877 domain-containing protein [Pasteurellaceae bacterium 22721_9_1]
MTNYTEEELQQLAQQWNGDKHGVVKIEFDLSQAHIYDSRLTSVPFELSICKYYRQLAVQLLNQSNKAGLRHLLLWDKADDFVFQSVGKVLAQAKCAFLQQNEREFAHYLAKLIGVGIGLTPSGDDFLSGVLALLHKIGLKQTALFAELQLAIQQNLARTNEISAAFLTCALENHFSQPVIHFFEQNSPQNSTALFQEFDQIGHSSGMDTICGIYFMSKLLAETTLDLKS